MEEGRVERVNAEVSGLEGQNACRKFDGPIPERKRRWKVASGVELATCELEHGKEADVAPSTSPVHLPGLNMAASSRNFCILPDARGGSGWVSAASSWTPCIHPETRGSTEWRPEKAGGGGTVDDCCAVPPILAQGRGRQKGRVEKTRSRRRNS